MKNTSKLLVIATLLALVGVSCKTKTASGFGYEPGSTTIQKLDKAGNVSGEWHDVRDVQTNGKDVRFKTHDGYNVELQKTPFRYEQKPAGVNW